MFSSKWSAGLVLATNLLFSVLGSEFIVSSKADGLVPNPMINEHTFASKKFLAGLFGKGGASSSSSLTATTSISYYSFYQAAHEFHKKKEGDQTYWLADSLIKMMKTLTSEPVSLCDWIVSNKQKVDQFLEEAMQALDMPDLLTFRERIWVAGIIVALETGKGEGPYDIGSLDPEICQQINAIRRKSIFWLT